MTVISFNNDLEHRNSDLLQVFGTHLRQILERITKAQYFGGLSDFCR